MTLRSVLFAGTMLLTIAAADTAAQQRIEVQPFFGGRFGGGFDVDAPVPGGFRVAEVDFESGPVYGFTAGVFVTQMVQLEFLLSRQQTGIEVDGVKISDASHTQYHGNVLFHFGDDDSKVRPYVLFGLGASTVSPPASSRTVNSRNSSASICKPAPSASLVRTRRAGTRSRATEIETSVSWVTARGAAWVTRCA